MYQYDYEKFLRILNETKGLHNALYEILKYDFIYNSNRIEGSNFTLESLQLLLEKSIVTGTHTLDDIRITLNSFTVFDLIIDNIGNELTLEMIKNLHGKLMYRTRLYDMGVAGAFKKYPNRIMGMEGNTVEPCKVEDEINKIIVEFYAKEKIELNDVAEFHYKFETIHPFQDGNGRIGRFIYLKQLLDNRLALKYINGESAKEYKMALRTCSKYTIKPLADYLERQNDFITKNINMF